MKTFIRPIEQLDFKGKRVFLRVDFNVPVKDGVIQDPRRIDEAIPTIKYILEKEAKLVIGSHFGRPDGKYSEKLSMTPIAEYLGEKLGGHDVLLVDEPDSDAPKALLNGLKPRQIIMLENLRFLKGEEENSDTLANKWASFTDIYINDAFGVSHRAHCSVSALPRVIPKRAYGFLVKKEIKNLSKLIEQPQSPFGLILGGAKVSDKITIIDRLLPKADVFIIGGAMAYTFLKAKGVRVGASRVEEDKVAFAREFLATCERKGKKVLLPIDHIVSANLESDEVHEVSVIADSRMALDIGPKTIELYTKEIAKLKTIFWNGPMGVFEIPSFENGTKAICKAISDNEGFTVIGGGDSASAALKFGGDFSHISTGGGASLEYLEGKELPGLASLKLTRNEIAGLQRIEWISEEVTDEKTGENE
jgi:phosphoglycerate kinase